MGCRWLISLALCAWGCGRIGYDGVDDGGVSSSKVQHASAFVGLDTVVQVPLRDPVVADELIAVLVSTTQGNAIDAPTDSQGNTYTLALAQNAMAANDAKIALFTSVATTTSENTITCRLAVDRDNIHCHVYVLHALAYMAVPFSYDAAGATPSVSTTTSRASSYVLAYFAGNNSMGTFTPGAGYADFEQTSSPSNDVAFSEGSLALTPGDYTATIDVTAPDSFNAAFIVFAPP